MARMTRGQSNATNWNGDSQDSIPVTKLFAHFVSSTTYGTLSSTVKAKLKELLLDYIGVASGAAVQSESSKLHTYCNPISRRQWIQHCHLQRTRLYCAICCASEWRFRPF